MGMPVAISIAEEFAKGQDIAEIFAYFRHIDERFSTYKDSSEITKINLGLIDEAHYSQEMKEVFSLAAITKEETNGFFSIERNMKIDPSGIVKGYAISKGADMLRQKGYKNFYVEIAGDIEVSGFNEKGEKWRVGIQNPFNTKEIVKVVKLTDCGVATSGNYRRGKHIYDPKTGELVDEIMSITVIAKNCFDADRFATAAFAMGEKGINFLEMREEAEGYMITKAKRGIFTTGFAKYLLD